MEGWNDDKGQFKSRLYTLWKNIKNKWKRAKDDADALEHDRAIFPKKTHDNHGVTLWRGSSAEKYLKKDMADGVHLRTTTKEFYKSRPEYQWYNIKKFRSHVYQEKATMKHRVKFDKKVSRFDNDGKKQNGKASKKEAKTDDNDDDDDNSESSSKKDDLDFV